MDTLTQLADTELLLKGATALASFFEPDAGCFLRTTGPSPLRRDDKGGRFPPDTGATSSNRALLAGVEVLFYLCEEDLFEVEPADTPEARVRWQQLGQDLADIVRGMTDIYYSEPLETLQAHSENGRNDFTDSHLTIAFATLASRFARRHLRVEPPALTGSSLRELSESLESQLEAGGGASLSSDGVPHPLITLHAVRAVEVARHLSDEIDGRSRVIDAVETKVRTRARDDVLRQLGLHAADDAEFDPAALIAAAALLFRFAGLSARGLVRKSLEVLRDTQGADGSWRTRIITGDRQLIFIPSLELAVIVANLALWDTAEGSLELFELATPILERSLAFLRAGYREAELESGRPSAGWANDQARQPDVVESWSTALALQLLLRCRRLARRASQHLILIKYRVKAPDLSRREWLRWYDLAGPIALVRSIDAERARAAIELRRVSDPSASGAVNRATRDQIVDPVLSDTFDRPGRTRSFLLYGPPGTRKTSLVAAVAAALDWPLVTLAPPDFLRGGIAAFETEAEQIFQDLLNVRRVVVFFDECEELFRRRTVGTSPDHRTQSDFITSGMLPRLQDLRDRGWVIFAIATNTELDEIDPAVSRFGRLDGQQRIGHPEVGAQLRYIVEGFELPETLLPSVQEALERYEGFLDAEIQPVNRTTLVERRRAAGYEYKQDGKLRKYFEQVDALRAQEAELPLVSFGALDQFGAIVAKQDREWTVDNLYRELYSLCSNKGRPTQWTEE